MKHSFLTLMAAVLFQLSAHAALVTRSSFNEATNSLQAQIAQKASTNAATIGSLTVGTNLTLNGATASRFLVTDASGYVTNTVAATGTGAPVLQESPAITNITAVAGNVVVSMPAAFAWPGPGLTVWRTTNGIYSSSIRAKQYDTQTQRVTLFVDGKGNDSNDGLTPWTPKLTFGGALAAGATYTNVAYELADGVYPTTVAVTVTNNISIYCRRGNAAITKYGIGGNSFILSTTDGGTNTYVAASHTPTAVYDFGSPVFLGAPRQLTNVADLATCKVTLGSWVVDTGNCYVTMPDNRKPDSNLITVANNGTVLMSLRKNTYVENVRFLGGLTGLAVDSFTTTNTAAFLSCAFVGSEGNAFHLRNNDGFVVLENCGAYYATSDGFNHNVLSTWGSSCSLEIDNIGAFNGLSAPANDNGSTVHSGYWIVRVNGIYAANGDRNVHDVGNGGSWNLGCAAGWPVAQDRANFALGATGDTTKMWLDGCRVIGNATLDAKLFDTTQAMYWRSATMSTNGWVLSGSLTAY